MRRIFFGFSGKGVMVCLRRFTVLFLAVSLMGLSVGTVQATVVISEIMYNPVGTGGGLDGDEFEFLELTNVGPDPVDLSGAAFTDGITYTFDEGVSLSAGDRLVVVPNRAAFAARYPGAPDPVRRRRRAQCARAGPQPLPR